MPRTPSSARRPKRQSDEFDDEEAQDFNQQQHEINLSAHLLEEARPPRLGRPPKDEEEKRQVYTSLAYLKSARQSNKECARLLDVSERTIANYLHDPLYAEVQNELQSTAKQQGHTTISMLIDEALGKLYSLMHTANSHFVQYKSAEKLLDVAGYNLPREEAHADSREEVAKFLELVKNRSAGGGVQVNVQVNTPSTPASPSALPEPSVVTEVVDMLSTPARNKGEVPAELEPYYRTVLPGGKLPSME